MPTTREIVETVLRVQDEASKKLERIEKSAGKTSNQVEGLISKLKGLVAPLAAAFGLVRSITGAKEYVAQIERIQSLTNMSANNIAGMTHAMQISGLQGMEMEMIFENMAVKQADFKKGMAGAVEQSRRLGIDLRQGPQQQLIEMARLVEQGKLGTAGVKEMTQASGPALVGLMDLLRKGSKDVTSLLEEGRQKNRHITNDTVKSFKKFDTMMTKVKLAWVRISTIVLSKLMPGLTKSGLKFETIIESWAEGAAKVGSMIASVGSFLSRHSRLLMTLVKALLIMKAGKMIGGFFIAQANQISAMFGAMAKNAGGVNKGLGGMIGKLGRTVTGLATFYVALQGIADWVSERQERGIKEEVKMTRIREMAPRATKVQEQIEGRLQRGETRKDISAEKAVRNVVRKNIEEAVFLGMVKTKMVRGEEGKMLKRVVIDFAKVADRFELSSRQITLMAKRETTAQKLRILDVTGARKAATFVRNTREFLGIAAQDTKMLSLETLKRLKFTRALAARRKALGLPALGVKAPDEREKNVINQDFRGSRFDIRQDFAEGFDPTRVATVMANDLASLGERRMQSGLAPLFAVR